MKSQEVPNAFMKIVKSFMIIAFKYPNYSEKSDELFLFFGEGVQLARDGRIFGIPFNSKFVLCIDPLRHPVGGR